MRRTSPTLPDQTPVRIVYAHCNEVSYNAFIYCLNGDLVLDDEDQTHGWVLPDDWKYGRMYNHGPFDKHWLKAEPWNSTDAWFVILPDNPAYEPGAWTDAGEPVLLK